MSLRALNRAGVVVVIINCAGEKKREREDEDSMEAYPANGMRSKKISEPSQHEHGLHSVRLTCDADHRAHNTYDSLACRRDVNS